MKTIKPVGPEQNKDGRLNARKGRAYPNREKMLPQKPAAISQTGSGGFRPEPGMMFAMLWNNLF
ncbi:hypothetical protein FPZ43_18310 [Mucilaginibacter pallidiroseus]|uniref:Uncharacterized protein n=1 Tax=Mucilaginibacter pallidiroseus TaxID=2599295 RepID=A0A563TYN6_9SPHI|nr:hypothetical protein [Mucilaginibacter pallidiroseus]TWR24383.1 hypothetical protein FPZ43_18310 [Mucilaginibacter pallidiroseus]